MLYLTFNFRLENPLLVFFIKPLPLKTQPQRGANLPLRNLNAFRGSSCHPLLAFSSHIPPTCHPFSTHFPFSMATVMRRKPNEACTSRTLFAYAGKLIPRFANPDPRPLTPRRPFPAHLRIHCLASKFAGN